MILYHGSSQNIDKTLKTHRAFNLYGYDKVVYCTDIKEIALAYAISPIDCYIKNKFGVDKHYKAISAHIRYSNGVLELMELYPNMFETIYHNICYIYVCDEDDFEQCENEFKIHHDVEFIDKIFIKDVYEEIKNLVKIGKIKLYKYEDLDYIKTNRQLNHLESGLEGRASYCSSKEEMDFFEMVSNYFPSVKRRIKLAD